MFDPDLTHRDLELLCQPTLASQFPVCFANGVRFTGIACDCPDCGQRLADEVFRGELAWHGPHLVTVEGSGICHACQILNRCRYRLHDDGRVTGPDESGQWRTWPVRSSARTGWIDRLLRWLAMLCGKR